MSLFKKKESINSSELREAIRNPSHGLPTDSKIFDKDVREKIIGGLFKDKGEIIDKSEVNKVIDEIRSGKFEILKDFKQSDKDQLIRYLKEKTGI